MWAVVAGPYLAGCILLIAAGAPKLSDPLPLVRALRSTGLPGRPALVRLVAAVEVTLGVVALADPGRWTAAAVLFSYLIFSVFIAVVLRRGGTLASCGCFGGADTPATSSHLFITAALAAVAGAVCLGPATSPRWPGGSPVLLVVTAGYAALLAFLMYLVLGVLPTADRATIRASATRPGGPARVGRRS